MSVRGPVPSSWFQIIHCRTKSHCSGALSRINQTLKETLIISDQNHGRISEKSDAKIPAAVVRAGDGGSAPLWEPAWLPERGAWLGSIGRTGPAWIKMAVEAERRLVPEGSAPRFLPF